MCNYNSFFQNNTKVYDKLIGIFYQIIIKVFFVNISPAETVCYYKDCTQSKDFNFNNKLLFIAFSISSDESLRLENNNAYTPIQITIICFIRSLTILS